MDHGRCRRGVDLRKTYSSIKKFKKTGEENINKEKTHNLHAERKLLQSELLSWVRVLMKHGLCPIVFTNLMIHSSNKYCQVKLSWTLSCLEFLMDLDQLWQIDF